MNEKSLKDTPLALISVVILFKNCKPQEQDLKTDTICEYLFQVVSELTACVGSLFKYIE